MPAVGRATCTIPYEVDQLGALAALGIDPPDLLRAYYRLYAGTGSAELMEQGGTGTRRSAGGAAQARRSSSGP